MLFTTLLCFAGFAAAANNNAPVAVDEDGKVTDVTEAVIVHNGAKSVVLAIWEKDLTTGRTSTGLWDAEFANLLQYDCSNRVSAVAFGIEVEFNANDKGAGSVTVNGVEHPIAAGVDAAAGISCSRIYSHQQASAECYIPLEQIVQTRDLPGLEGNSTVECYPDGIGLDPSLLIGVSWDAEEELAADLTSDIFDADVEESNPKGRQGPSIERRQLDRARPHPNPVPYSTGKETSYSVTHTATFNFAGLGRLEWISGGYSVSYTWGQSKIYNCEGERGDIICLKHRRYFQGYRAELMRHDFWGRPYEKVRDVWIRSPVQAESHNGDGHYCVVNGCHGEGNTHWQHVGPGLLKVA
ncbi:uncharacterized protein VDAG_01838 [Verticillium dahliae VdLs.17]|uniref:Uncharacterized protein n=1 Tax=Verticillium dahliae (strain VdLs.17 / ATCC MYA-4575 / FGSC 10137) TaxID=498257 RepID=G2WW52_VERDV|nr:uncharacterized protein VDAG_01838 [Verticillium dahliae VdLs.17]EGY19822.1 hypothetical protein VDAG_01838 [Verticillium dahliae VdLs.17]KAF3350197.1 Pre-mRNA-splicing factor cwc23 [Verticillium dahliae VDG2]KAH6706133.1 hypothetical protein EV126DRAFT_491073 [Verticillium dahliae]